MKVPFTSPIDHLHMGKTSVSIHTSRAGYITRVCPVLSKNTIHIHAPVVYLLYSNNDNIAAIRERSEISSLFHLEVDQTEMAKQR